MKIIRTFVLALTFMGIVAGNANADFKAEIKEKGNAYKKLVNSIVEQAVSGQIDQAKVTKEAKDLVKIGVWYAQQYAKAYPESEKMMQILIDNAVTTDANGNVTGFGDMVSLSIEQIEELWHDKGILHQAGNDLAFDPDDEDYEHFSNPWDGIVHPATAAVLAHEWSKSKDEAHLSQMKAELIEVLEHRDLIEEYLLMKADAFAQR